MRPRCSAQANTWYSQLSVSVSCSGPVPPVYGTPAAVLASSQKDGSYSALSTAQLDAGEQDQNLWKRSSHYSFHPAVTSYTSQVAFPPLAQSTVYSSFPQSGQTYGLPPFGSSFTTSSVYSNIPSATAISSASAAAGPQDFSSYSSLGQTQFSQYYQLPPNYTPAGLTSSDEHSAGAGVAGYSAVKSEEAAPAGLPPRDASPPENLPAAAALPTGGARDQEEAGRRNSVGKSKGKAKKSESSSPASSDLEVSVQQNLLQVNLNAGDNNVFRVTWSNSLVQLL
ncbi:hypothetical protein GOODEAATRI_008971 [Goodea atripinnis]|uniref:Eyes absent homolog n=1 Tax=Goodea atripinnis TaxID=208336 RepID=A0ABV0MG89_9TELE